MAIFYKPFKIFRIALCVLSLCFAGAPSAQAQSYTIEGVEVDVSANNAIAARDKAFEQAQREAFKRLAAQFMGPSEMAGFQAPEASVISPMIRDYEVTKEKLSKTRYIGAYTFRFKENYVQSYFGKYRKPGIAAPFGNEVTNAATASESDAPASPDMKKNKLSLVNPNAARESYLILPFYQQGGQTALWSPYNAWMQAWRRANMPPELIVPVGDLSDVNDITDDQALTYDEAGVMRMLTRYNAREAVSLVAAPDGEFALAQTETSPVNGVLRVAIFRVDRSGGAEQAAEVSIIANPGETRGRAFDRAVNLVQKTLGGDWRNMSFDPAPQAEAIAPQSYINIRLPLTSLREWAAARRELDATPGVRDVSLKSLSPREARLAVAYDGGAEGLRAALAQKGMELSETGSGGSTDNLPVYDLYPKGAYAPPVEIYEPEQAQPSPSSEAADMPRPAGGFFNRRSDAAPYIKTF